MTGVIRYDVRLGSQTDGNLEFDEMSNDERQHVVVDGVGESMEQLKPRSVFSHDHPVP
jgi:hypothetical protein